MWTLHKQQQHCGAQLPMRERQAGEAPAEATRDRAAQEHDRAGDGSLQPGDYPASAIEHRDQDITPSAPEGSVEWDEVVQPQQRRAPERDDQQEQQTELEQDQRDDASKRERAVERDAGERANPER